MEEINFFSTKDNEYKFLSNFYPAPFVASINNSELTYPTSEHFYQAMKAAIWEDHEKIRNMPTPGKAMRLGRRVKQIGRWEDIKVNVMKNALTFKFTQNADLRRKLLDTGDAILHEDSPTDMFWGKKGEDMLGKLLMQVRSELRLQEQAIQSNDKESKEEIEGRL